MRWRAEGRNDGREAAVECRRGVRLSLTGLIK